MDNTEIAEEILMDLRPEIAAKLYTTVYEEDGTVFYEKTPLGDKLFCQIVKTLNKCKNTNL